MGQLMTSIACMRGGLKVIVNNPSPLRIRRQEKIKKKIDMVFVNESMQGKGPEYVFSGAGVQMRPIRSASLSELQMALGLRKILKRQ